MENYGDYEQPFYGCGRTLCGYETEKPCETATSDWEEVSCKKCLKLRKRYEISRQIDEKIIVEQMGDTADWWEKQKDKEGVV